VEYGLGVDLGTTYTAAAIRTNGRIEIAQLGGRRFPRLSTSAPTAQPSSAKRPNAVAPLNPGGSLASSSAASATPCPSSSAVRPTPPTL
jgi:molecular chaperone DnaK (HSP70)